MQMAITRGECDTHHSSVLKDVGYALVQAYVALGAFYEDGCGGVDIDERRAAELFQKAAQKLYVPGMLALGESYEAGRGVAKDEARAFALFEAACRRDVNSGAAFYALGACYASGRGTAKNERAAAAAFQRALAHQEVRAHVCLGVMQLEGRVVPREVDRALINIQHAANHGHPAGQYVYAVLLLHGMVAAEQARLERDGCYLFVRLQLMTRECCSLV